MLLKHYKSILKALIVIFLIPFIFLLMDLRPDSNLIADYFGLVTESDTPARQMELLKNSKIFGQQGYESGPNAFCFKYTSDEERNRWLIPDQYIACFVINACYNSKLKTVFVSNLHTPSLNTTNWHLPGIEIKRGSDELLKQMRRFSYRESAPSFITRRFEEHNLFHTTFDWNVPIFTHLLNTGLLNLETLEWTTGEKVKLYSITDTPSPKRTFDQSFNKYLNIPNEINDEFQRSPPLVDVCFDSLLLGYNSAVRVDERSVVSLPPPNAPPLEQSCLYSRFIVSNIINDHMITGYKQIVANERKKNAQTAVDINDYYAYSKWLGEIESKHVWPLLSQQSNSPTGTHILLLRRLKNRIILNFDELSDRFLKEFVIDRGYSVHIDDFEGVSIEEQILRSARATVFASSHGAGMTHAIWMRPQSVLFETIASCNWRQFFPVVAADNGLAMVRYVEGNVSDRKSENANITVNVDEWLKKMRYAVWLSDKEFGKPLGCRKPVLKNDIFD